MNAAILYREHAIFFILLAKNLSMLNRKIRVKLLSHSCGLAGWFAWYGITKGSKLGKKNVLFVLLESLPCITK